MSLSFQRATKKQARGRIALIGVSGSGKTYTALGIGTNLGTRVALIDTERGSASKYSDEFEFDVLELDSFHPQKFIDAIGAAEAAGYDVLIIDSLSHAWMGKEGALELVDKAAKRGGSGNSFGAWREITPLHNALVDSIVRSRCHVIVTIRAKTDYVQEKNERTGRSEVRKVGLAPVQRDGLEYEFDVVGDVDIEHNLVITKTRCRALDAGVFNKAGKDVADRLNVWLGDGAPAEVPPPAPVVAQTPVQASVTQMPARKPDATSPATTATNPSVDEAKNVAMREKRAQGIVAMKLVTRDGDKCIVRTPSLRGRSAEYIVTRDDAGKVRCSCLEFETSVKANPAYRCEHIIAVKLFLTNADVTPQAEVAPTIDSTPAASNDLPWACSLENRTQVETVWDAAVAAGIEDATLFQRLDEFGFQELHELTDAKAPEFAASLQGLIDYKLNSEKENAV